MKEGAIPTLNLPLKSCPNKVTIERSRSAIEKRESRIIEEPPQIEIPVYNDFSSFEKKVKNLKLNGWEVSFINYVKYLEMGPMFSSI